MDFLRRQRLAADFDRLLKLAGPIATASAGDSRCSR